PTNANAWDGFIDWNFRRDGRFDCRSGTLDGECDWLAAMRLDVIGDCERAEHFLSIDCGNDVTFFQTGALGGALRNDALDRCAARLERKLDVSSAALDIEFHRLARVAADVIGDAEDVKKRLAVDAGDEVVRFQSRFVRGTSWFD